MPKHNMYQQPRPESLAVLPEGASGVPGMETSRDIELARLQENLAACGDNWRSAQAVQARIDRLIST